MKRVSAIITTHNRFEYFCKAYESVKNQTYKNIEIIIVDDASTDETEEYCRKLKDVKYIRIDQKDSKGGNYARNLGIKAAAGDYIALLDDDDEWLPEKTEKEVKAFEKNDKIGLVVCGRKNEVKTSKGVRYSETSVVPNIQLDYSRLIFGNSISPTSAIMFRADILKKELFDENLKFWQEYDVMMRICQYALVGWVNEPLVLYRINLKDKNRLSNKFDGWWETISYLDKKYQEQLEKLPESIRVRRRVMIYEDTINRAPSNKVKREFLWKLLKVKNSPKVFIRLIFALSRNDIERMRGA